MSTLTAVILAILYLAAMWFLGHMFRLTRDRAYIVALIYCSGFPLIALAERLLVDQSCCQTVLWGTVWKIYALSFTGVVIYTIAERYLPFPFITASDLSRRIEQLYEQGELHQCTRASHQLVAQSPWDVNARYTLGKLLNEKGMSGRAIEHLQIAKRLAPNSLEVLLELGNAYQHADNFPRAIEAYNQVLSMDASNLEASERIAMCQKKINSLNDPK